MADGATVSRAEGWASATVMQLQQRGILLVEDGNHGEYRPRPNEFTSVGTAFIRAADIDNGSVLFSSSSKINQTALDRITKGIGAPGDVLLTHKGTVGKVALVPDDAPPFVCSPQTTFWRTLDQKVLNRRYLHAFLRSPSFHQQLASRAGETDMAPYVSLTAQRTLVVVLPSTLEQAAIGSIIGALDDKIELNRRMNETLEEMARALFKSWFVDFEGQLAFTDSVLGPIPVGWAAGPVSELCLRVENGGTPKRSVHEYWAPQEVRWLTSGEVRQSLVDSTESFISKSGLENSSAKLWPRKTTIVAMYGATAGEVCLTDIELCTNQACCGLIAEEGYQLFVYFSMRHWREYWHFVESGVRRRLVSAAVTALATRDRAGGVSRAEARASRRSFRGANIHAALAIGVGRPRARKRLIPSELRTGFAVMNRSLASR